MDGKALYKKLSDVEKKKVIWCDKRAQEKSYHLYRKKVYSPEMLLGKENDIPILITSTRYSKEIFIELINRGISFTRLKVNRIAASSLKR